MGTPGTGQDIEDTCTRCGDTWHVVVAKVGERVAKVICKLCGSQHNYRKGAEAIAAAKADAATSRGTTLKRKVSRTSVPTMPAPPPFDPSKPPRPYSPKDSFMPGERIVHPTFGEGIVTGSVPGKIEVVFPTGQRVLAGPKTNSSLSRPEHVANAPLYDRPPKLL